MSSNSSGNKGCLLAIICAVICSRSDGIIGGILGFLIGGIGDIIINKISSTASASGNDERMENAYGNRRDTSGRPEDNPFFVAYFSLLAKMAKADGVVSIEEAEVIKRQIYDLFSMEEERQAIKRIFNRARDDERSFESYCLYFAETVQEAALRQCAMRLLCEIAAADGVLKPEELRCLRFAESVLNLQGYVDSFFHLNSNYQQHREYGSRQNYQPEAEEDLSFAYRILGVSSDASDNEVKKAYREKCRQCHPDILRSKGMPESMLKKAESEMQRINAAYDRICRSRNHKN